MTVEEYKQPLILETCIWALVMNFNLFRRSSGLRQRGQMSCSAQPVQRVTWYWFVPLDIRGCHTKKAHLCTDICYTLTPVMQTSHNGSCNIFLTVKDLDSPFDWSRAFSETKQKQRCNRVTSPNQATEILVILWHWEWLSEKFLLTVFKSRLHEVPLFNKVCGGIPLFPLFHFCGLQWPVILSH